METFVTEDSPPNGKAEKTKESDSAEHFQRFVYDLFEKNGILSDLRAYLRGHIVDVLKSAQTGEPFNCQRHFTQRLDLTYQAFNILIAEYLLRLEFSYSLSVFVSEIPLANMVFGFAKKLMLNKGADFEDLRFKENDIWSILNYLGVKCDSEYASHIVEMYNSKENIPLLFCILKCMPMYHHKGIDVEDKAISSSDSLSSAKSINILNEKFIKNASKMSSQEKCKHYIFCKTCQYKATRLKEKYKAKKKHLIKTVNSFDANQLNVEFFMKNIEVMEKGLIDEMFQQLKNVYETEVEMMKQDEEKKIKRTLASHAFELQRQRDEMEESFKAREAELENNVQEKKKFLWGLARALRDQHAAMTRAMHAVRLDTDRLAAKEESLKSQLFEAETVLRKRGEDMRQQISNELVILEEHLESMKRERESINRERADLESLRTACNSSNVIKSQDLDNENLKSHYGLLKDELVILKKYLETAKLEPKCVIERSTLTELSDVSSKIHVVLNNDIERPPLRTESEERRTPNKVVNDLKKQKNVNFSSPNVEEFYHECAYDSSRPSVSSKVSDVNVVADRNNELVERLREENDHLKTFARQQREHIDELSSHRARLQAELTASRYRTDCIARPHTAPLPCQEPAHRLNTSASFHSVGWRKGGGEEMSLFTNAQPRILLPGDTMPFIGVLRDKNYDNRRHLINQWRALRRRMSPINVGRLRGSVSPQRDRIPQETLGTLSPVTPAFVSAQNENDVQDTAHSRMNETFTFTAISRETPKNTTRQVIEIHQPREKSPKSVLREAKEKLKNKSYDKYQVPTTTRDKSPTAVLREAKLRLRKLEIEAEAVEKSYMDFRKRQAELQQTRASENSSDKNTHILGDCGNFAALKEEQRNISNHRIKESYNTNTQHVPISYQNSTKHDFDKYLCEYQSKFNATASHFKDTGNAAAKSKPIPIVYGEIDKQLDDSQERKDNYLETPLAEFRKLYTQKSSTYRPPVLIARSESPERIQDKLYSPKSPYSNINNLPSQNNNENIQPTANSPKESTEYKSKSVRINEKELKILRDNIGKMYNIQKQSEIDKKIEVMNESPRDEIIDNILVEVEEVTECNSMQITESNIGDLLVVVESSVDRKELVIAESEIQQEAQLTVLVSPRSNSNRVKEELEKAIERNLTPEQEAILTRNDVLDTLFDEDGIKQTSIEIDLNISKDLIEEEMIGKYVSDGSLEQAVKFSSDEVLEAIFPANVNRQQSSTELDINISKDLIEDCISDEKGGEDYLDDFSADVDNYNSGSEYNNNSPISLPKTSEDDNFWDS